VAKEGAAIHDDPFSEFNLSSKAEATVFWSCGFGNGIGGGRIVMNLSRRRGGAANGELSSFPHVHLNDQLKAMLGSF
jgi:hypothetical protein